MVGGTGIEPVATAMSTQCSTAELTAHPFRGARGLLQEGWLYNADRLPQARGFVCGTKFTCPILRPGRASPLP
jgi:hypothetical protein